MAPNQQFQIQPWSCVWRGESSGELFEEFDLAKTRHGIGFFFAQREDHAAFYAGQGTRPRQFQIDPGRLLDLRDPCHRALSDPDTAKVIDALRADFDEWVDRHSGENKDVLDFLEAGNLYDYEGTGSGQRWNRLFIHARDHGFDTVAVLDNTDGVSGEDALVWVVFDPARIHASPAPSLSRTRRPAF